MVFDLKYHAPLWATKTGHLLILNGKDMTSAPYDRARARVPDLLENSVESAVDDIVITLPPGYALEDKPDDIHRNDARSATMIRP